jgi:hypothetical protein
MCGASAVKREFLVEVFVVVKANLELFKGKIAGKRATLRAERRVSSFFGLSVCLRKVAAMSQPKGLIGWISIPLASASSCPELKVSHFG